MKRKIHRVLSSINYRLLAFALTLLSGKAYTQTTYTFNYTGGQQTLALQPGTYTIETWGADGGNNLGNSSTTYLQNGGKGGYSMGIYTLTSATTIYVNVGGKGANSTSALNTTVSGGYNGGGYGSANSASGKSSGAGGGGASHVATATGALSTLLSNTTSVLIVAGGGGGAGECNYVNTNTQYNSNGGNGGGLSGLQNVSSSYQGRHGQGGTQVAGGGGGDNGSAVAGVPLQGIFGAGGYNNTTNGNTNAGGSGAGGGGGGWYGGGAGWVGSTGFQAGSGGGGSGYIGGVTNGTTIVSGQSGFVTNPDVSGNGMVRIKELCNITLSSLTGSGINAICNGNSATLTTNAVSNYSWSTGASSSSVVVSPTTTTTYSLGATSVSNCVAYAAITITVNGSAPNLSVANTASASGGICPTETVMLTASGALSYNWAGGSIPVTNGVVFSPTSAVNYTVTGVNGCGTTTAVTSVSVHPFPTVNPVASTSTLCSGSSLSLTATGNATNYAWSGGSVPVGGGSFVPSSTTTYTVIGTSALSCTAVATIPVTVYPTPINAPTANPALICIGESSTLTATGALNYTWTSSSQTVNTASFVVSPNIGSTTYTCTKANSSCYNTQMVTVVTNSLPTIFAIVTPTVVCALTPATLAVGGAQTYTWTSPGPPTYTFTGASPVVSPVGPSTYTVAASDGTCINTTTVFLNANPNPTITVSASSPTICEGQSVSLTASGGINYSWTTSGTATFTGAAITDSPTIATAYNVTGDNSFGCTSGANQVVLVYPKPTLTVSTNKSLVCSGGSATLSATGANTYSWDPNANSVLTATALVNPTALTSSAVMYTVQGTNSGTGCKNTQTVLVNVYIPTLTISGNTNTCAGGLITLNSSGGNIGSYNWDIGDGNPHPTSNISATLAAPGVFTLSANSTSLGVTCPATETIALGIYYNPTITAVPERTLICLKESVGITADGGISYNWSNNMTGPTITITPLSGIVANFTVTGTDANGCSSTATVQVKISGCNSINELTGSNHGISIYPNPNDGRFTIQTDKDLKLNLVNELGQLVRVIILSESNNHEVNVTDLAKGIYFVTGQKGNLQIYQKIVVTK